MKWGKNSKMYQKLGFVLILAVMTAAVFTKIFKDTNAAQEGITVDLSDETGSELSTISPETGEASIAGTDEYEGVNCVSEATRGWNEAVIEVRNPNHIGNTSGNLSNNGIVAQQDDWTYFAIPDSGVIYKIKEGEEKVLVARFETDNPIQSLNVCGKWIYFSKGYIDAEHPGEICRVDLEGGNPETLINDIRDPAFLVVDGKILYTYAQQVSASRTGLGIASYNIENGMTEFGELVTEGPDLSSSYAVKKMRIFGYENGAVYVVESYEEMGKYGYGEIGGNLAIINDCAGESETREYLFSDCRHIIFYPFTINGRLLLEDWNAGHTFLMFDLQDRSLMYEKEMGMNSDFRPKNGTDSYILADDAGALFCFPRQGEYQFESADLVVEDFAYYMGIAGDWIYYTMSEDHIYSIYRVRMDGSNWEEIEA